MQSFDFAAHPVSETVALLAEYLTSIAQQNDSNIVHLYDPATNAPYCPAYTPFHARGVPSIDIQAYLTRILKYCSCSNDCLIAIMVYFDRLTRGMGAKGPRKFAVDSYNVHRLVIVAIMVATKFFSDVFYTNVRYSKVGGLSVSELNFLEMQFLALHEFNVHINPSELQRYADALLNNISPVASPAPAPAPKASETELARFTAPDTQPATMQTWTPPSTPTPSGESTPIIVNSNEFKNACHLSKSFSSADITIPVKKSFVESRIGTIPRSTPTRADLTSHYSSSVPLKSQPRSSARSRVVSTEMGKSIDLLFKKSSIQSGRTYDSNLSNILGTNTSRNVHALKSW
ncbi:cyclin-domain-containing protein [Basidiobolus meristosporus CBS 931.73]|uniref:Cyclin-domain-containing protein n=1 Tax=Basidiobolus meristosporus CBS 931.73 TaxID=1314790 RepID=A0A1Y1XVI3_9FUNG|nr:cyclin-domain-containing protein [Basidiobolus meristosporus CBS 931.73]|eukprot:ORX89759.1 cyclin-domain-containing protein [Basidiobolus meristosporus CBS 931.73]